MRVKPNPSVSPLVYFVDDDDEDRQFFEIAMSLSVPDCEVQTFASGPALMQVTNETYRKPALIFLDVDMPITDGFAVLTSLKMQEDWASIPVIMLTVSDNAEKIKLGYRLGAQSWLIKPDSLTSLASMMSTVRQYWFGTSQNPYAA